MKPAPRSRLLARLLPRTTASTASTSRANKGTADAATSGSASPLPADTASALQNALAAEHAAIWTYGLATAFVAGQAANEVAAGTTTHTARRDATERLLTDGGQPPKTAEPAYLTPQPVTGQTSAAAVIAVAESDVGVAWRAVLERTDDADLRKTGLAALMDSAVRQTRWRRLAGQSPASVAMPGQPTG